MLLWGWLYSLLLRQMAQAKIEQAREQRLRMQRQRRQRVGLEPLSKDLRAEEERLLSILSERRRG